MQGQQTAKGTGRYTYKNEMRGGALVADKGGDKRERKGGATVRKISDRRR